MNKVCICVYLRWDVSGGSVVDDESRRRKPPKSELKLATLEKRMQRVERTCPEGGWEYTMNKKKDERKKRRKNITTDTKRGSKFAHVCKSSEAFGKMRISLEVTCNANLVQFGGSFWIYLSLGLSYSSSSSSRILKFKKRHSIKLDPWLS